MLKEGIALVSYSELFQFVLVLIAIASLVYKIAKK